MLLMCLFKGARVDTAVADFQASAFGPSAAGTEILTSLQGSLTFESYPGKEKVLIRAWQSEGASGTKPVPREVVYIFRFDLSTPKVFVLDPAKKEFRTLYYEDGFERSFERAFGLNPWKTESGSGKEARPFLQAEAGREGLALSYTSTETGILRLLTDGERGGLAVSAEWEGAERAQVLFSRPRGRPGPDDSLFEPPAGYKEVR